MKNLNEGWSIFGVSIFVDSLISTCFLATRKSLNDGPSLGRDRIDKLRVARRNLIDAKLNLSITITRECFEMAYRLIIRPFKLWRCEIFMNPHSGTHMIIHWMDLKFHEIMIRRVLYLPDLNFGRNHNKLAFQFQSLGIISGSGI